MHYILVSKNFQEVCSQSVKHFVLFCLSSLPEWHKWRASGAGGRRGVYPSPSGWRAGVSRTNLVVQGRLYPGSAAVPPLALWSMRSAGGAFLWQIWHLRTLERHPAEGPKAPRDTTLSSQTWLSTEQGPVSNWHPLGPGECCCCFCFFCAEKKITPNSVFW